ncbi:hypothetical protein BKA70DRAFT_308967 [Coprinopsis sp. MPI-PUGE-AT-0042]|nr:hypothetical protein BKA70DRAFT_308967 [Coprinopsis sp. MPI-PUGE-AT-0042]
MPQRPVNSLGLSIPSRRPRHEYVDVDMPDMEDDDVYDSYTRAPSEEIPLSPTIVTEFADKDMTRQVAINFLDFAERALEDRPRVYKEFVLSMQDWHRGLIRRHELITRIRSLFDGDWQLLQTFRPFIPQIYLKDWDTFRLGVQIPDREL